MTLRPRWATLALVAGVDIEIVSERLGHSSPMMTWQTYQHVVKGMRTGAAEKGRQPQRRRWLRTARRRSA